MAGLTKSNHATASQTESPPGILIVSGKVV